MLIVFALGSALLYGSADFLGGAATRRATLVAVLLTSALAGVAVQLPAALLAGGPPHSEGIEWGLAAGGIGGFGLMFFYAGLAAGPMSVVSPVAALVSTVLPVAVAAAQGERPSLLVIVGAVLCLAATVLVSSGAATTATTWRERARGIGYGVASGASFGLFFLFMKEAGQSGGPLWPTLTSRCTGLLIYLVAAGVTRAAPVTWRAGFPLFAAAIGAGALDAGANICYVLATRAGLFGPAVVLTSLYPGATVLLARILLRERMHRTQQAGLLLAAAGIALITA
ncbi:MAG TPA: DMT family transporter [Streptosporangiaceae bacterium]|jgi:drug/metabolite transporter (DMT)-like permease